MSGITGLYHLDGCTVERSLLEGMTHALAHRGPDHAAVWIGEHIGLGHTLRHTTIPSLAEAQPVADAAGQYILTADARLDNRDELIRLLEWRRPPAETPDSALILAAYQRWGAPCLGHLLGAFAFAIWDAPRHTLFCARDHFGLRPVYYAHTEQHIAFASEIKALLPLPWVSTSIDETSVADYLMLMMEDKASTFYKAVRRLPPAHTLTATPDGVTVAPYWSLDPQRNVVYASDAEYTEAFRTHFVEAVQCRLRSAFPVGTTLSGGLDSSSITCVTRSLLGATDENPLDTFSLVFDEVQASVERHYSIAVRAQGGIRSHEIRGDQLGVIDELDDMLWHLDEPFMGPNLFLHWGMYKAAQQQQTRVLLDGFLGDSVVWHGIEYLTEMAARGRWTALARELRAAAALFSSLTGKPAKQHHRQLLRKYVWTPLLKEPLRHARFMLGKPSLPSSPQSPFINPDFARYIGYMDRARRLGQVYPRSARSMRTAHYEELTSGLIPRSLEVTERTASAFGLDVRYPFADQRLVTFCLALPPTQRLHQGVTRLILRRAMKDYLPEAIRTRHTKAKLSHNLAHSMRTRSRAALQSLFYERLTILAPFVDIQRLQEAYRRFDEGHTSGHLMLIWQIAALTRWMELQTRTPAYTSHRDLPKILL